MSAIRSLCTILIFGCIITKVSSQDLSLQCSDGWVNLYEKCYLLVPYNFTWDKANSFCQKYGAVLAEPSGYQLTGLLSTHTQSLGFQRYWIGYNRRQITSEPAYNGLWSDGRGTSVHVGVWAPNQPDVTSGNCAYVGDPWDVMDTSHRWYMTSCDNVMPAVCERTPCPSDTFSCHSGRCVWSRSVCNGGDDCGDASDEMNCPSRCTYSYSGSHGSVNVTSAEYRPRSTCLHNIHVDSGKRIQMKFTSFSTEAGLDVVEIWDGGPTLSTSSLVTRLSGTDSLPSYVSSVNHLIVRFITDGSFEKSGFSFTWSTDFSCEMVERPSHRFPRSTSGFTLPLTSRQTVDKCVQDCQRNPVCWGFQYQEASSGERSCFMVTEIPVLEPHSCCDVFINTCPGLTRTPAVPAVPMSASVLEAGAAPQALTTPLYPLPYVGNYQQAFLITSRANTVITLQVVTVDLCCEDFISIHDGNGRSSGRLLTIGQHSSPDTVISSGQNMYIHMDLSQHWNCTGVLMKYTEGCDVMLMGDSGNVRSPGYDVTNYPDIMTCSWTILPLSGNSVRLQFTGFETEENTDLLEVYVGTDAAGAPDHPGFGYSGQVLPSTVMSGAGLYLRFTTSATINHRGFHAAYSSGCPVLDPKSIVITPAAASYHYPDVVMITCAEGYFFAGGNAGRTSVQMDCLSDGTWSAQNLPFCERGYCGFAPLVENGYVDMALGVQGGDHVTYACDEGYTLIGPNNVTCLSENQWSASPTCEGTHCEKLGTFIPTAKFNILRGDGIQHGTVVRVTCPQYYELIGPETVTCDAGVWEIATPSCEPIPCAVPLIWNGNVNRTATHTRNSAVAVQCDAGYHVTGHPVTISAGTYRCGVEDPIICTDIDECLIGTDLCEHATCSNTDGGYTCTCLPGYARVAFNAHACEDVNECATDNGLCSQNCTNTQGSYRCSCRHGYDLYTSPGHGGLDLPSGQDGSQPWHLFHLNHSCVLKSCPAQHITGIANGLAMTSKSTFFYGDVVNVICNIGFYLNGTSNSKGRATCGVDGQWDLRPACEFAYCNEIQFAALNVTPSRPIRYGEQYTLTCSLANGDLVIRQRTCGYDHTSHRYVTSGSDLTCPDVELNSSLIDTNEITETDCGEVPVVTGMAAFVTPCTTFGCQVMFECEPQYERVGSGPRDLPIVVCNADGIWDFGSQFCRGGQCGQPPQPYDGYTTLTSWQHAAHIVHSTALGSVATFSCNRRGYTPSPVASTTCVKVGTRSMAWDFSGAVTCVDTEPPVFHSCPTEVIIQMNLYPVFFDDPYVVDNTAVAQLDRYPTNFRSGMAGDAGQMTFIARDFAGNQEWCSFRITVRDKTAPQIYCELPDVETVTPDSKLVHTYIYSRTNDPTATTSSFPEYVTASFDTIGTNPILSFTATDLNGNTASCKSQMRIAAPKCTPATLQVYNGQVTCGAQASGYTCTITCNENYYFYEDVTRSSIVLTCQAGGDWSRELPICTPVDVSHYRAVYRFEYILGPYVDASCAAVYKSGIQSQLTNLINAFVPLCANVTSDGSIDVSPAANIQVQTEIVPGGNLVVRLPIEITPSNLRDVEYQSCAARIFMAINDVTGTVSSIASLNGTQSGNGQGCPTTVMRVDSNNYDNQSYICNNAGKSVQFDSDRHKCVACPPGTYSQDEQCVACSAGTYNNQYYARTCQPCPAGTNSQATGARYTKDCYDDCGQYLVSRSGKAPCADCPRDTYWVNSTYCQTCPSGTFTKHRGARNVTACVASCERGSYSHDGLEPCRVCPRNFYQASRGQLTCQECASFQMTLAANSTSSTDCIDAGPTQCYPNPCNNAGTCMVIAHEYFCNCSIGYSGRTCEILYDPCSSNPCQNGGGCQQTGVTNYTCMCLARFSGRNCETDVDDCANVTCQNNGTCLDEVGGFMCACASHNGHYGDMCDREQDPCMRFPCNNSGECVPQAQYFRVCNCPPGYTGVDCETNIDECNPNPCINDGFCTDDSNGFTCTCPAGFNGVFCERRNDDDTCGGSTCSTAVSCIDNYVDEYGYCICQDGWYYDEQVRACSVFDDYCASFNCGLHGTCASYDGGYHLTCLCDLGYAGSTCQYDVDDCLYRPCLNSGMCNDGLNDFTCSCPVNGTGGKICGDNVNGCLNCVTAHTDSCTDTLDGYTCYCKDGFTGHNCQTEIPSCDWLPCKHGGVCTNAVTSSDHVCTCSAPWSGDTCETEVDNCATSPCQQGATCHSTSAGFYCECPVNMRGVLCDEVYELCERARPCVDNNTCIQTDWHTATCACQEGYTGESCQTLLWYCDDTTCENGATCHVLPGQGVDCICPLGFSGPRCETSTNDCIQKTCPANAYCVDGVDSAHCVCNEGKIGENCDKGIPEVFDYLISPPRGCSSQSRYEPYNLASTTGISLAFWLRVTDLNQPSSILSLYGVHNSNTSRPSSWQRLLHMGGERVEFSLARSPVVTETLYLTGSGVTIQDGLWHHVVVGWSNSPGTLTLFVDGQYVTEKLFARNQNIPDKGLLQLGSSWGEARLFTGRVSRLQVYNYKLEDSEVLDVYHGNMASQPPIETFKASMSHYTVDYASEFSPRTCQGAAPCVNYAFNVTASPRVSSCPSDTLFIGERVSRPDWGSPTFSGTVPGTRISTHVPGVSQIGWGVYGVGYAEYSSSGEAAVCTFRLYSKRKGCTEVPSTAGVSQQCTSVTGGGMRCEISCSADLRPSHDKPVYYTCSMYGMWDSADRTVDFLYPSCAATTQPVNRVRVVYQYNLTSTCTGQPASLRSAVMDVILALNEATGRTLCMTEGGTDYTCESTNLQVTCGNAVVTRSTHNNVASVEFDMIHLSDRVTYRGRRMTPYDVIKTAFRDESKFHVSSAGDLVFSSVDIRASRMCSAGHQLLEDIDRCLRCGNGAYYNTSLSRCVPCPRGSYRTLVPSSNPLGTCTACSGSGTTDNTGSLSRNYCHDSCFYGNYYNGITARCEKCAVGFYSDVIGASSCSACGINDTTDDVGATTRTDCTPLPMPPTLSGSEPDLGASTERGGLSAGVISAIVIGVVIFVLVIVVVICICCCNILPCWKDDRKIVPGAGAPWKHVHRYGETNMRHVNHRLSDIREGKTHPADDLPIYPPTPDDSLNVTSDINVHVPIFLEKLHGAVTKKQTYISGGRASEMTSDLDQTLDRPPSERAFSAGAGLSDSGHYAPAVKDHAPHYHHRGPADPGMTPGDTGLTPGAMSTLRRSGRHGRPPTDFSPTRQQPPAIPRTLTPLSLRRTLPAVPPTSGYIRPSSSMMRQRQEVTPQHYQEFLEHRGSRDQGPSTPTTSQMGSDKILLDSEDEDLR